MKIEVGIIGAMQIEVEALCAAMEQTGTETVSGVTFVSGVLYGHTCVVACCGVGKVFAALCAEAMILRYAPDYILNTGVGGTLTECLSIGDIAVSRDVVQYDMDTSAIGDPVGLISGIDLVHIPADADLCNRLVHAAVSCGVNTLCGTVCSADRFLNDNEIKHEIVNRFGGVVCEMEGGAIGHVCYVNRVPFCVLRSISDCANGDAPEDFPAFTRRATETSMRVLQEFLTDSCR